MKAEPSVRRRAPTITLTLCAVCSAVHAAWAVLPTLASAPAAAGVVAVSQSQQYRERQVFDPQTGEWIDQPPAVEGTPQGDLEIARSLLARDDPGGARRILRRWLKENADHERFVEATFLLGEAEFLRGRYYQAYERYEYVVENSGGEMFHRALRREMDVARAFLAGKKRLVWGFLYLPAYDDGVEILDRVWERVPGTRIGEEALALIADYRFAVGEMDLAQDEYARLVGEYPSGRHTARGMLRAAEAAEAAFGGVKFDARPLLEAEERYRQFSAAFPTYADEQHVDERLRQIGRLRAQKDLDVARWYEGVRQPQAAVFYYQLIVRDWPDSVEAAAARQRLEALGAEAPPAEAEGSR